MRNPKPTDLQICRNKYGTVYVRKVPYTTFIPSKAQAKHRVMFGMVSKMATGKKMEGKIPPSAELIQKAFKGIKYPDNWKVQHKKKWEIMIEKLYQQQMAERIKQTIKQIAEQYKIVK